MCPMKAEWNAIGTNLLNSQTVAIKFVRRVFFAPDLHLGPPRRLLSVLVQEKRAPYRATHVIACVSFSDVFRFFFD